MQVAVTPTYSHARDLPFKRVIGRYHPCREDPKRHSLGLDLDSWLPHIMLVLWLSVGLLCTDMQCLCNLSREFRVIYSKSSTTSKIMSCSLALNAAFIRFSRGGSFITQNAALDIKNLAHVTQKYQTIRFGESRAQSCTISKCFWHVFFFIDDEGKQYWTCNCLNTRYTTVYFSSVWVGPLIYWSTVVPSSFQPPSFEDA